MNCQAVSGQKSEFKHGVSRRQFLSRLTRTSLFCAMFSGAQARGEGASEESGTVPEIFSHPYMRVMNSEYLCRKIEYSTTYKKPSLEVLEVLRVIEKFQQKLERNELPRTLGSVRELWKTLKKYSFLELAHESPSLDSYTKLMAGTVPDLCASYGVHASPNLLFTPKDDENNRIPLVVNQFSKIESISYEQVAVSGSHVRVPLVTVKGAPEEITGTTSKPSRATPWSDFGAVCIDSSAINARVEFINTARKKFEVEAHRDFAEIVKQLDSVQLVSHLEEKEILFDEALAISISVYRALQQLAPSKEWEREIVSSESKRLAYRIASPDVPHPIWLALLSQPWKEPYSFCQRLAVSFRIDEYLEELSKSDQRRAALADMCAYYSMRSQPLESHGEAKVWIVEMAMTVVSQNPERFHVKIVPGVDPYLQALLCLPEVIESKEGRDQLISMLRRHRTSRDNEEAKLLMKEIEVKHERSYLVPLAGAATLASALGGLAIARTVLNHQLLLRIELLVDDSELASSIYRRLQIGVCEKKVNWPQRRSATETLLQIAEESCAGRFSSRIRGLLSSLSGLSVFSSEDSDRVQSLMTKFKS